MSQTEDDLSPDCTKLTEILGLSDPKEIAAKLSELSRKRVGEGAVRKWFQRDRIPQWVVALLSTKAHGDKMSQNGEQRGLGLEFEFSYSAKAKSSVTPAEIATWPPETARWYFDILGRFAEKLPDQKQGASKTEITVPRPPEARPPDAGGGGGKLESSGG